MDIFKRIRDIFNSLKDIRNSAISVIELKISEILLEISIIELQISVMRITDICNSPKYELLPSTVPRIKMVGPHVIDSMLFSLIYERPFQTKSFSFYH